MVNLKRASRELFRRLTVHGPGDETRRIRGGVEAHGDVAGRSRIKGMGKLGNQARITMYPPDHQPFGKSQQRANDLLFTPGFSTASSVSEISGRGVGLDVVKRNIQELKGTIDVKSTQSATGILYVVVIVTFIGPWNEFLWPFLITKEADMQPLAVSLANYINNVAGRAANPFGQLHPGQTKQFPALCDP